MPQEFNLQAAIHEAIQTEKDVMDFYNKAAEITKNERAKKVFLTLAAEEREHASNFFHLYTGAELGSFEDFMASPPRDVSAMLSQLLQALDEAASERKAMELALAEEENLAKNLRATAALIVDPAVRGVFEKMAQETDDHYQIIEAEYAFMMGMVHDTDIDTYVRE